MSITMRDRLLVRLYPQRWRRRYEAEFTALLEEERASVSLLLDIVSGAVTAHLTSYPTAEEPPVTRRIQTVAAVAAALLVLPALVFLMSAAVRQLQPVQYEPARTADAIFGWFTGLHDGGAILWAAPALALALGLVVLWRRLTSDTELRRDVVVLGAVLVRLVRRPVLVAGAFSVLASLVVLTFYVVHAIAG
jgi:hypothetical protein